MGARLRGDDNGVVRSLLFQVSNSRRAEDLKAIIASEAKQSIVQQERKLDCFASLAMRFSEQTHKSDSVDG
jgi:hypothetical protein